jgi:hypothetical protein
MKKPTAPTTKTIPLPAGILKADTEYQPYNPKKPDPIVDRLTFHLRIPANPRAQL